MRITIFVWPSEAGRQITRFGMSIPFDRIRGLPVVYSHAPPNLLRYVPSQAGGQVPNGEIRAQMSYSSQWEAVW